MKKTRLVNADFLANPFVAYMVVSNLKINQFFSRL